MKNKRLTLSSTDEKIGGVCGGLGEFFGIDPTIFRILFVFAVLFLGQGVLIYLILWVVLPEEGDYTGTVIVNDKQKRDDLL